MPPISEFLTVESLNEAKARLEGKLIRRGNDRIGIVESVKEYTDWYRGMYGTRNSFPEDRIVMTVRDRTGVLSYHRIDMSEIEIWGE